MTKRFPKVPKRVLIQDIIDNYEMDAIAVADRLEDLQTTVNGLLERVRTLEQRPTPGRVLAYPTGCSKHLLCHCDESE